MGAGKTLDSSKARAAPRKDVVRKARKHDRPRASPRTLITPAMLGAMLADIAAGEPTRRVLATYRISGRQFYGLLDSDAAVAERYARARASSMDAIADDAMRIADDPDIPSDQKRVMVDTRKWFLSKLAPKRYGDKIDVEHSGAVATNLIISDD